MDDRHTTDGWLKTGDVLYPVQLETVSRTGAVVRLRGESCDTLVPGDECWLVMECGKDKEPLAVSAHVVHYSFTLAGLKFIEYDLQRDKDLEAVIERITRNRTESMLSANPLHRHLGSLLPPQ